MSLNLPRTFGALAGPVPLSYLDDNFGALSLLSVDSISQIRNLSKSGIGRVIATGYYSAGDGGGGQYIYVSTDTTSSDNGCTIIVANDGGRWYLVYTGMLSICQWGVLSTNTAAVNAANLTAALNWAIPLGQTLWWPAININCAAISVSDTTACGVRIRGAGKSFSRVNYSSIGAASWLTITGASGTLVQAAIEDIGFDGATTSTAIELRGIDGQKIKNCDFGVNALAVLFNNYASGSFTEYCVLEGCNIQTTCLRWIEYSIASGNSSFHGSGISGRTTCNTPSTAYTNLIKVGANCNVYNAPLDIQVWVNASGTMLQNNNTGSPSINNCNWSGKITLEPFTTGFIFASGYARTYFSGPIISSNQNLNLGVLQQVRNLISYSSGICDVIFENCQRTVTGLTTGTAIDFGGGLWYTSQNKVALLNVTLVGANYRYSYLLALQYANGQGGSDTLVTLATFQQFNTAGWGAPTFSINSSLQLVITNASSGFSVTATVGVTQLGGCDLVP